MGHESRSGSRDPIWYAVALIAVLVALVVFTGLMFFGTFRSFVPVAVVSDRAGLVMETRASVKLRGVKVGEVAAISPQLNSARLELKLFPDAVAYIPDNVQVEIKATTAFGSKYVDLIVPGDPSSTPLAAGAVLRARNVTVEVNTVFENLKAVVDAVDPAKLNGILTALADSLRGKGEVLGQAITATNDVLLAVNPRMPTVQHDLQSLKQTTDVYSAAARDILAIIDAATTTSATIVDHRSDLDKLLIAAIGFGSRGVDVIGGNAPNLVRSINVLEPTTDLLMKYQPGLTCLLVGSKWFLDNAEPFGGNGKSLTIDAGLLLGDNAYRYPQHLPTVNATGGPGGKPGCGSLPDPSANYPVRALVTDSGFGANPDDIRTQPGVAHPWWVNFFPGTRAVPEPPSYRGRR